MFGGFGHWEILLIGLVVVVVFGAKRLPDLGRGLGEGLKGFKDALKGGGSEDPKLGEGDDSEPEA